MTEPAIKEVEIVDVVDRLEDIAESLTALSAVAKLLGERQPDHITVTAPNVSIPKPEVTVHSPVTVTVPERKSESFLVHDIERDDSKLIKSFRITVEK